MTIRGGKKPQDAHWKSQFTELSIEWHSRRGVHSVGNTDGHEGPDVGSSDHLYEHQLTLVKIV